MYQAFLSYNKFVSFKGNILYIDNEKNRDLATLNDSGAIKGMDAREDGVYITYVPAAGADAVTKKLGSFNSPTLVYSNGGNFSWTADKAGRYILVTMNTIETNGASVSLSGGYTNYTKIFDYYGAARHETIDVSTYILVALMDFDKGNTLSIGRNTFNASISRTAIIFLCDK